MKRFLAIGLAIGAMVFGGRAAGQDDYASVDIKTTHVSGNIYMLEGRGGNIGVSAGEDGILIVDDQFAPLADKIKAALGKLSDGKLKFVLNTHWHFDHVGGNPIFGREAPIIAHKNVRERVSTPQTLFGQERKPLPKEGWPVITFGQSLSIHFNGEEIRVVHFPNGHTDGDSVIFFSGSNVIHMGDDLFSGMFPFVDLDHGGDVVGLANNIGSILEGLPADIKIIPGHGPLSTADDLRDFHRMLVETTDIVRSRMAKGKTLKEIQSEGLPDKYKSWSGGFITTERWLEIVFNSLSKRRSGT